MRIERTPAGQTASVVFCLLGGLVILPARMQEVQTWTRLGEPFTRARTLWMLGFQRRLVRRWEWLNRIPNEGCLPHMSQVAAMGARLLGNGSRDEGQG